MIDFFAGKKFVLIAADVVLAGDEHEGRAGLAIALGEGVEQGNYAGVGGRDPESKRTSDGERDHKSD
jgi:hypothetical protein